MKKAFYYFLTTHTEKPDTSALSNKYTHCSCWVNTEYVQVIPVLAHWTPLLGNKSKQIKKKALLLPSSKLSGSSGVTDHRQEGSPNVGDFYSEPKRLFSSSWVLANVILFRSLSVTYAEKNVSVTPFWFWNFGEMISNYWHIKKYFLLSRQMMRIAWPAWVTVTFFLFPQYLSRVKARDACTEICWETTIVWSAQSWMTPSPL